MTGRVVGQLYDHRDEPTIWKLVKPLADGSFGVLAAGGTVLRIDRRSNVLFSTPTASTTTSTSPPTGSSSPPPGAPAGCPRSAA